MADAGVGEAAAAEGAKSAGEAAAVDGTVAAGADAAAGDVIAGGVAAGAGDAAVAGGAAAAGGSAAAGGGLTFGQQLALQGVSMVGSSLLKPQAAQALGLNGQGIQTVSAPTLMPSPDDQAIAEAKKKSIIEQMANRGRASTILTDNSDKLGG